MRDGVHSIVCATCGEPFEAGHVCGSVKSDAARSRSIHRICDKLAEDRVPDWVIAPIREYAESLVQKAVS